MSDARLLSDEEWRRAVDNSAIDNADCARARFTILDDRDARKEQVARLSVALENIRARASVAHRGWIAEVARVALLAETEEP